MSDQPYSRLLIPDYTLQILPDLAVEIGLNEAIVLQQVHYWLLPSRGVGKIVDGRRWVYNTYEKWKENFPFWSVPTIKRTISSLEKQGLLESRSDLNGHASDRTKWYTINYEHPVLQADQPVIRPSDQIDPLDGSKRSALHITKTTSETTPPKAGEEEHEERFERFWDAYPKKENRKWCHAWWMKKKPDEQLTNHMIAAVKAQAKEKRWTPERKQFIPLPSTWLNNDRWTDEVSGMPSIHVNTKPASEMTEAERIQAEIDEENREKRMYGAERVQWFIAKHARLDELKKEQGA